MSKRLFPSVLAVIILIEVLALLILGTAMHSFHKHPIQFIPVSQPDVIMEVLDPTLEDGALLWQAEIGRRFHNAVGIVVHGGDFVQGEWIVEGNYASGEHVQLATDVVKRYQALFPDRTIVLISCNPGHLKLGIPGVYYAMSSVWVIPDRAVTPDMEQGKVKATIDYDNNPDDPTTEPTEGDSSPDPTSSAPVQTRWQQSPDDVGSIFEFVSE